MKNLILSSPGFGWPVFDVDLKKLVAIHKELDDPGNQYKLGGKWPLALDPDQAEGRRVDCSGYVRWLLYHASPEDKRLVIPDGSVVQRDWIEAQGFKVSTVDAGKRLDGYLRMAFLPPGGGVGHVSLILDGRTLESWGGAGPDSRAWDGLGWQARTVVYVVALPDV